MREGIVSGNLTIVKPYHLGSFPGMAIQWRLNDMLGARGLSPYRLAQLTGLSGPTCYELAKANYRPGRIDAGSLAKICQALECQPGDLLVFVSDKSGKKR